MSYVKLIEIGHPLSGFWLKACVEPIRRKGKLPKDPMWKGPKLRSTKSWLHPLLYWNPPPPPISWNIIIWIKKLSVFVCTLASFYAVLQHLTTTIPYQALQTATHLQLHVSHPCPQCPRSLSISTLSLPLLSSMLLHFLWALHQGTGEKGPESDELPEKQV